MKDALSEQRLALLHPKARDTFKAFIEEAESIHRTKFRIAQGLRSIEEQDELYNQGRINPGKIVTNARGGKSYHNYGLAIDIVEMMPDGKVNWSFDYKKLLPLVLKYKLTWGGNFKSIKDKPHYELSFNQSVSKLFEKYKKKDFIPGTCYINL